MAVARTGISVPERNPGPRLTSGSPTNSGDPQ
ncbi:hypothetical protein TrispH2_008153 [Trichoplax sp. H2]|nr:hypothetical protein TrispH2_008153 [Trichoplax sp. H2]|eukprot:RDD40427.1 hypothetical protein TrispH2_008153 [Trichoplax sp. H2]